MYKNILLLLCFLVAGLLQNLKAQEIFGNNKEVSYTNPQEFTLAGVQVLGTKFVDKEVLIMLSGLKIGEKITIPGDKVSKAINNLWSQGLFGDIDVYVDKIENENIFIIIDLQERPRLTRIAFSKNLKKGTVNSLNEKLKQYKGKIVTPNLVVSTKAVVRDYFVEKGNWDVKIDVEEVADSLLKNGMMVKVRVDPGKRIKINKIIIEGNQALASKKIKRLMKGTKEKGIARIFSSSKFLDKNFEADKIKIIDKYQDLGHRDAKIVFDTAYKATPQAFDVKMVIDEGVQYKFRHIDFVGNTLYPDSILHKILGIKRGDIFNAGILDARLKGDPTGRDISTLYMDDGYLFFQIEPIEVNIEKDSIDLEVRIVEGAQATVNKVTITGNDKTNDHVVLREIRTRPGQKFSRTDIIRTQRELSQLGYFDPESFGVNPVPNPVDGTVDIEYKLAERSSDQIELSGGWGAGTVVGSLGLVLNNFSARNIFNRKSWRPLPSGDGQRLSLRGQSNGLFFRSFNIAFTEPWFGGKKRNAFSVNFFNTVQSNGFPRGDSRRGVFITNGVGVSLGKQLTLPDDFFSLVHSVNYQQYFIENFAALGVLPQGVTNDLYFREVLSRNSIDQPIFPRSGSSFSLSLQFTPPYSWFRPNRLNSDGKPEQSKWVEYHKWRFDANYYIPVIEKFVLMTRVQYGFIGSYSSAQSFVPFGRFQLGGDGIMGFNLIGVELLGLRGYNNNSITPRLSDGSLLGGTAFHKYTMELRYPLTTNPSATIFMTSFLEAGNNFLNTKQFNPFNTLRSGGFGVRVFLPMFGLLGLDWGYGFDEVPGLPGANKGQLHVSIGQQF